nr:GNAT family N-acetyltransferase [Pseudomonas sp. R5(2019)]
MHYRLLDELQQPLLNKFYKDQNSSMRSVKGARLWVARTPEIVAGLCLKPLPEGFWLTGLWVDPNWRQRRVAGELVESAVRGCETPVWLFCHPDLCPFYRRLGFEPAGDTLPTLLCEKLVRYQRNKALVALERVNRPAADQAPETALR